MPGPLTGIKVVEISNFISGPYCAMLLADQGAEVIKVELPGTGDPFRQWSERKGEMLPQFAAYNRGKKSVTINVQTEGGQDAFRRLASHADVVLENFRPGYMDKHGIGFGALQDLNQKLVYCAISGMGSSGPYSHRPTYDAIAQAMSGLWSHFTDMENPEPIGPPLADQLTGMYGCNAILGALVARGITGRGQKVEVSMLSACVAFLTTSVADYQLTGEINHRFSRPHRSQSYAFVGSDNLPFGIHLSSPQKFWQALSEVVGQPELVNDPRFNNKVNRVKNYTLLHDYLAEIFRTRPRAEWLKLLDEKDVPAAPIYNVAETLADPQVQHNQMVRTFGQGERSINLVGYAAQFSRTPSEPDLPPPAIGEHNDEVFSQLGYSSQDVERMRAEGAV